MLCPKCSTPLDARFSHGIEIDVCPECGGAWLDRGEIDKLTAVNEPRVLATSQTGSSDVQDGGQQPPPPKAPKVKTKKKSDERTSSEKKKKKRKKGWADQLEDILDDVLDLDDLFD